MAGKTVLAVISAVGLSLAAFWLAGETPAGQAGARSRSPARQSRPQPRSSRKSSRMRASASAQPVPAAGPGGRHKRRNGSQPEPAARRPWRGGPRGARARTGTEAKAGTKEPPVEPKPLPASYEQESRLLGKVYSLRDRALNEEMRGNYGDAVKQLSQAVEISNQYYGGKPSPAESQLYMELGKAAEEAGQDDLAKRSYGESLNRNPNCTDVRVRLAALLAKTGDPVGAAEQARKAVALDPDDPRAHHLLGLLLEKQGDLEAARAEKAKSKALLRAGARHKPARLEPGAEPDKAGDKGEPGEQAPEEIPPDMPLGLP